MYVCAILAVLAQMHEGGQLLRPELSAGKLVRLLQLPGFDPLCVAGGLAHGRWRL